MGRKKGEEERGEGDVILSVTIQVYGSVDQLAVFRCELEMNERIDKISTIFHFDFLLLSLQSAFLWIYTLAQ